MPCKSIDIVSLKHELSISPEAVNPPSEIQIIPYGSYETEKGLFTLDEEGVKSVIEDFNNRKNDMVIDYEHQTLRGTEAPAAGWIKKLVNRGKDGIWAAVEWTDRAKEYFRNREYRYLSPVFLKRISDNRVVRLVNAALTNQPAIDGMVPVVNRATEYQSVTPVEAVIQKQDGIDSCFRRNDNKAKEVVMKKLLEALGLPVDAEEEQAIEAVRDLKSQISNLKSRAAHKEMLDALGLKGSATLSEVTGTIQAMKQGHAQAGDLGKKVVSLEEKLRKKEASELTEAAMKQGKVTPAQKDWAMSYAKRDPEGFKTFVAKAPVAVPMGEVGTARNDRDSGVGDEVQAHVNKALDIDDETFKKHNKEKEA